MNGFAIILFTAGAKICELEGRAKEKTQNTTHKNINIGERGEEI